MKKLRIIFMGTPEFAVPALERIYNAGFEIAAVVTAPDKAAGRGMLLTESAVKKFAAAKNLKILQPEKLKNPEFISELRSLNADMQIVVAFRMLPEIVWNMPPLGTINLHASLLPQYRGAAPINWAIINGEKETGLTTFKLKHEIDTGNILLQKKLGIGDSETAGELHERMMEIGAQLLLKTINEIVENNVEEQLQNASAIYAQENKNLFHAPKIFTETCKIKWDRDANEIYNLIRGLSPHPAAFTFLNGKKIKVFKAEKEFTEVKESPGEMITNHKSFLKYACRNGYILINELQIEGRRKMKVEEFLRGWKIIT